MSSSHDGPSDSAQLIADQDEFLEGTDQESTATSSTDWKPPSEIDWSKISERGKAIKLRIVDEMSDGYSLTTIAQELGQTPSWVSDRLAELRREIMLTHTTNHLYPLSREEIDNLRDSVKQYGIQTPVLVGDHTIIDGRHRFLVAQELGIEVPAYFIQGLSKEEEHDIALAVNSVRRQMSQKQKHDIVRRELLANWEKSDRSLAAVCGVSAPTIGRIRDELRREQEAEPSQDDVAAAREDKERVLREPEVRVDRRGREFEVKPKAEQTRTKLSYNACPGCGVLLTVTRIGDSYHLIHERD